MAKDRLKELIANQNNMELDQVHIEMGSLSQTTDMDSFLREVNKLQENINAIELVINNVKLLQENILVNPNSDNNLRDELDERMNEIKANALKIRQNLKTMATLINQEEQTSNRVTTELKIKKTQYSNLSKKFYDIMAVYNLAQAEYKEKCKKRIQRQLEITGRQADDEYIEEMLESKKPQIFTEGILSETKMARQALADIEARHKDILMLEKNILELNEMFTEMAYLVESQGQMVDNIESNMFQTTENVETAKQNTVSAVTNAKKVRKKKLLVALIVAIIIAIIVVILIVVLAIYIPKK